MKNDDADCEFWKLKLLWLIVKRKNTKKRKFSHFSRHKTNFLSLYNKWLWKCQNEWEFFIFHACNPYLFYTYPHMYFFSPNMKSQRGSFRGLTVEKIICARRPKGCKGMNWTPPAYVCRVVEQFASNFSAVND